MPRRLSEAVVTEFLRDALAVDSVDVPELEARARAAGLLGERQRITHAKVFKRAKKFLGIRSVRNGFGDAGEWLWRLERQPASPVSKPLAQPPLSIEDTYAAMRKLLKKYRPTCDQVAFLPVGSTGSHASTTISRSPTSHRTDGASF